MIDIVRDAIGKYNMINRGDRVLCALSGGADSVALIYCLNWISQSIGFTLHACHINHMLRDEEALRDECFCKNLCDGLNIPIVVKQIDVKTYVKQHRLSVEDGARRLRYRFLKECAAEHGCNKIATAHNANDVLETFIINLARGASIKGLSSIPPVRDSIVRPLIDVKKVIIQDFLEKNNIDYVTDSTNFDEHYIRNKVRINIVPKLIDINSNVIENTINACKLLSKDSELISQISDKEFDNICKTSDGRCSCNITELLRNHYSVRSRMVIKMYDTVLQQGSLGKKHVDNVFGLCENTNISASINLPNGVVACRQYDRLIIKKYVECPETKPIKIEFDKEYKLPYNSVVLKISKEQGLSKKANTFYAGCDKIDLSSIIVRPRQAGDKIKLHINSGHKTLKKLFIEYRVPKDLRELIPVLADKDGIIAVYGVGIDRDRETDHGNNENIKIEFRGVSREE